jgi:hypothetical protein
LTIDDIDKNGSEFSRSQWFTRGWTLQELLAPKNVTFFSSTWKYLGTKSTVSTQISEITSIDRAFLEGEDLWSASIAHRMSWASKRVTKREEDIANCLLGIFDVNMPLIYGEGPKAFRRLQEEILRNSSDESLFAWWREDSSSAQQQDDTVHAPCGLLAQSPSDFASSADITEWPSEGGYSFETSSYAVSFQKLDDRLVKLQCRNRNDHGNLICLHIECALGTVNYCRANMKRLEHVPAADWPKSTQQKIQKIQVLKDRPSATRRQPVTFDIAIREAVSRVLSFTIQEITGENVHWDPAWKGLKRRESNKPFAACVRFRDDSLIEFTIWLLCRPKADFHLDYVVLTHVDDVFVFDEEGFKFIAKWEVPRVVTKAAMAH